MKKCTIAVLATALAGCASQPDEIHTAYASDLQYRNYDCEQLKMEVENVSRRASSLHGQLKETADNDAAQMGVGLLLFWPALFFLEGGDGAQAEEYARRKGEREAIERVAVQKKRGLEFSPEPNIERKKSVSGT